jgi:hypothetical protein
MKSKPKRARWAYRRRCGACDTKAFQYTRYSISKESTGVLRVRTVECALHDLLMIALVRNGPCHFQLHAQIADLQARVAPLTRANTALTAKAKRTEKNRGALGRNLESTLWSKSRISLTKLSAF